MPSSELKLSSPDLEPNKLEIGAKIVVDFSQCPTGSYIINRSERSDHKGTIVENHKILKYKVDFGEPIIEGESRSRYLDDVPHEAVRLQTD